MAAQGSVILVLVTAPVRPHPPINYVDMTRGTLPAPCAGQCGHQAGEQGQEPRWQRSRAPGVECLVLPQVREERGQGSGVGTGCSLGLLRLAPTTAQGYLLTSADQERWGTRLSPRPEVHTFTRLPLRNNWKAGPPLLSVPLSLIISGDGDHGEHCKHGRPWARARRPTLLSIGRPTHHGPPLQPIATSVPFLLSADLSHHRDGLQASPSIDGKTDSEEQGPGQGGGHAGPPTAQHHCGDYRPSGSFFLRVPLWRPPRSQAPKICAVSTLPRRAKWAGPTPHRH